jgi:hypothetical protein
MNPKEQTRQRSSGKDQADGQGEGRRDPFEAARPQPKDTPARHQQPSPDEKEERSDLADVGEADEQDGTVDGMKESQHQDPPATLPQERRHERRNNM